MSNFERLVNAVRELFFVFKIKCNSCLHTLRLLFLLIVPYPFRTLTIAKAILTLLTAARKNSVKVMLNQSLMFFVQVCHLRLGSVFDSLFLALDDQLNDTIFFISFTSYFPRYFSYFSNLLLVQLRLLNVLYRSIIIGVCTLKFQTNNFFIDGELNLNCV